MKIVILILTLFLSSCCDRQEVYTQETITSDFKIGKVGSPGNQTPIYKDTVGNVFGYYEYLPKNFNRRDNHALIFYWNGANAISGDGNSQLNNLLTQGLSKNINDGQHYPAIIISAMLSNWKKDDVHPFVSYILKKYKGHYNPQQVYMTGFSAGGGITIRYAADHPKRIAAIVPIAAAVIKPTSNQPSKAMAAIPSWLFHNKGDTKVESWRSISWHKALLNTGGNHKLTLYDSNSHYAWQEVYSNDDMWSWLFSHKKKLASRE